MREAASLAYEGATVLWMLSVFRLSSHRKTEGAASGGSRVAHVCMAGDQAGAARSGDGVDTRARMGMICELDSSSRYAMVDTLKSTLGACATCECSICMWRVHCV